MGSRRPDERIQRGRITDEQEMKVRVLTQASQNGGERDAETVVSAHGIDRYVDRTLQQR